ncbi:MAG: hypothetical protein JJT78_03995 [Leptospira sp.]|nr:hypothetical protein [Leptospira sp.]
MKKLLLIFTLILFSLNMILCKDVSFSYSTASDEEDRHSVSVSAKKQEDSVSEKLGYVILKDVPSYADNGIIKDIDSFEPNQNWLDRRNEMAKRKLEFYHNIYPYFGTIEKFGRQFFLVKKQIISYDYNLEPTKYDKIEGWVDSSFVGKYGTDMMKDSIKDNKDKSLISIMKLINKKEIRVQSLWDIEMRNQFKSPDGSAKFYSFVYYSRDKEYNTMGESDSPLTAMEKDGVFRLLVLPPSNDGHEPIDINGDGELEWVLHSMYEGGSAATIVAKNNGEYVKIISMTDSMGSTGECGLAILKHSQGNAPIYLDDTINYEENSGEENNFLCNFQVEKSKLKARVGTKIVEFSFDGKQLTRL